MSKDVVGKSADWHDSMMQFASSWWYVRLSCSQLFSVDLIGHNWRGVVCVDVTEIQRDSVSRWQLGASLLVLQVGGSWVTRISCHLLHIFTALHVMQTRYCDENSVCPSVRPSVCLSVCLSVTLEFFYRKFKALKVLENRTGAWKSLNSPIQTVQYQQLR